MSSTFHRLTARVIEPRRAGSDFRYRRDIVQRSSTTGRDPMTVRDTFGAGTRSEAAGASLSPCVFSARGWRHRPGRRVLYDPLHHAVMS